VQTSSTSLTPVLSIKRLADLRSRCMISFWCKYFIPWETSMATFSKDGRARTVFCLWRRSYILPPDKYSEIKTSYILKSTMLFPNKVIVNRKNLTWNMWLNKFDLWLGKGLGVLYMHQQIWQHFCAEFFCNDSIKKDELNINYKFYFNSKTASRRY